MDKIGNIYNTLFEGMPEYKYTRLIYEGLKRNIVNLLLILKTVY